MLYGLINVEHFFAFVLRFAFGFIAASRIIRLEVNDVKTH